MSNKDEVIAKKGNKKLVKCIVCGVVFDASIDICPVCGVGREYFIPHEEEVASFKNNTNESFVILGNGIAGITAAEAIRQRNETAKITIISNEEVLGYNRPMLTKNLSTLKDVYDILIYDNEWYEKNNIVNMLGATVTAIESEGKSIILKNGETLNFDKCIYALGARCFIPPIKGSDKAEVIAVRNIADVLRVKELMKKTKNTVVIGGGVLGLEAAWELSKLSKVTVLEVMPTLMGRQLDKSAGDFLEDLIIDAGIDFKIGAKITEITGDEFVTGVSLDTGEHYPADLVIISCGIKSNTEIAVTAGIDMNKAIIVNERMETSKENIYACGDCCEFNGVNYGIWPEALEMGRVAGANASGDDLSFELIPAALTFEGMNTGLFAAGDNGKNESLLYKTVEIIDRANKQLEKYYFVEEQFVGVILIGDTSKMAKLTDALNKKTSYHKMFK